MFRLPQPDGCAGNAAAPFQDGSNTSTQKNVLEELPLESEEELLPTFIVSCGCSNVAQEEIYHRPISPLAARNSAFVHDENNRDPRKILLTGFFVWILRLEDLKTFILGLSSSYRVIKYSLNHSSPHH